MRERINRLAKGIIDPETPEVSVQPKSLEHVEIAAGGLEKKELYITSLNGLHIKGLAYSSNPRVRVTNPSFGGLRNHVTYEIDCEYLEYGDVVEGSFHLVTNGGEMEIPYSFAVLAGVSGRALKRLKEPKDFAALAKQNYETAVQIFEYRDFVDVPFMQDLSVRCLYDGLLGRGNRYGQVEQFMIGLGLKNPVELLLEEPRREYRDISRNTEDSITLRRSGWGYLPVSVRIDGDFIQIARKNFTNDDFAGGVFEFPFRLSPGGLHGGKNYGRITFETLNASVTVEILVFQGKGGKDGESAAEAKGKPAGSAASGKSGGLAASEGPGGLDAKEKRGGLAASEGSVSPAASGKLAVDRSLSRYLKLRLEYECGQGEAEVLIRQMLDEVERLRFLSGPSVGISLLEAELDLLAGRTQQAREALEECREEIISNRLERPDLYCLFQYVYLRLEPDLERWESLGRLSRKYMEDGRGEYLLFFVFSRCEEQFCFENPGDALVRMKVLYGRGCHSPFLYGQALAVLNDAPQLLLGLGVFEVQVLYFGAKRGLIHEELALKTAKLASASRRYHALACVVLKDIYKKYPQKEILEAICSLMIRGDCRTESDFEWYEKALNESVSLTRLYEYFLYSLPENYEKLLPDEVLRYFTYDHNLDQNSRAVLYANIIRYMNEDAKLYKEYQKVMGAFAIDQVLKARIGRNLAVIYDAMIYPDMVDQPVAQILPSLLNACRVSCDDKRMRNVVVCYEELTEQGVYAIKDGSAYVPVYFEGSRILFEDAYGNRYADLHHRKVPVLHKPELEARCFEVYPEHAMLLLGACRKAGEKDVPDEEDIRVIDHAMGKLKLHPLYSRRLTGQVIRFYEETAARTQGDGARPNDGDAQEKAAAGSLNMKPLMAVNKELISRSQRVSMCQALIRFGYIQDAYKMIRKYYCVISPEKLRRLCSRMILNELFDQDELLLKLAHLVFESGQADSVILDYLCEHFNGGTEQMYRVLAEGVKERVETYDLEERLLAQMMFSGEADRIDRVFSLYMERKKTNESIVKAYFTMKSTEYFLEGKPAGDDVFRYLEGMIRGSVEKDKLSTIYLLALTKYYSGLAELEPEQKELCQTMVDILLGEGMVFSHFKPLARHVRIPEEIMDKAILQYMGHKDSRVELQVRIRPQEERFYSDDMRRVYQGIFIKQKVLFEGEVMEYRIYEHFGEERVLMCKGSLACDRKTSSDDGSRFQLLNQMSVFMDMKEEEGLKKAMQEYIRKTAVAEGLFGLM